MVIPILMHFLTFIRQRYIILHQTEALSGMKNNYVNKASIKGSFGSIYSQKSSSYFQMLKIGSEDFVIMKHIQYKTGVN